MAEIIRKSVILSLEVLDEYDEKKAKEVIRLEKVVDKYEDVLGSYLVKLSSTNLSTYDSQSMSIILHSISDFERISDHAMEIVKSSEELYIKGLSFTKNAKQEIDTLCRAINDIVNLTIDSFCQDKVETVMRVEPLEEVIDALSKNIKENHIKRLQKGECTIVMGFILEDILTGLERISDHCSNVAVEMITIYDNDYNTHAYFKNMTEEEHALFSKEYEKLIKRYTINKQDDIIMV